MSSSRREFFERAAAAVLGLKLQGGSELALPKQTFELEEWTVTQLQEALRTGRLTSQRITELYLGRIAAMDRVGPTLRHVIETNPDALAVASERDAERRAGRLRGALDGIPVIIKDNIDTADRMHTSAGLARARAFDRPGAMPG